MIGLILLRLEAGKEESVLAKIKDIKGVNKVQAVFGRWDLVATVEAQDLNALTSLVIKNIRAIDGVSATETLVSTAL
ncbi:MAG: Lrp/AsnC family transcriptional regulator [Elusimicrobia bacterium]|nr:MAG: Lrp/AsnC family transcriptional regulator [Elusimicrobiota bacterium]